MAAVGAPGLEGAVVVVALVMAMTDALADGQWMQVTGGHDGVALLDLHGVRRAGDGVEGRGLREALSSPFTSVVAVVGAKSEAPLRPRL
jgi:hypothetical protein